MAVTNDVVPCWHCGKRFPVSAAVCPECGSPNLWSRDDLDDLDAPSLRKPLLGGTFAGVVTALLLSALVAVLWAVVTQ